MTTMMRIATTIRRFSSTTWVPPPMVKNPLPPHPSELRALAALEESRNRKLTATLRPKNIDGNNSEGSISSRHLRTAGLIPGVIYGNSKDAKGGLNNPLNCKIAITTSHIDIQTQLRRNKNTFESRVYQLHLDVSKGGIHEDLAGIEGHDGSGVFTVLPRHCQMHPVLNQVICCNFLRYWPGRVIKIPLKYQGEELSPALKRGAFIMAANRFIDVTVNEGCEIPEFIEVECEGLRLKDTVRLDRLIKPEGVEWGKSVQPNFLVGSVFGRAKTAGDE